MRPVTDLWQLFTSLYSMLPTSKEYLTRAGLSARISAFILIGLFLAGVVVIRIISGLIHNHIPSHVVDCAHTHEPDSDAERGDAHSHDHAEPDTRGQNAADGSTESTPLLRGADARTFKSVPEIVQRGPDSASTAGQLRKEPFRFRFERHISLLMGGVKPLCDNDGPCYGFSQACGYECTKTLIPRTVPSDEESRPILPSHQTISVQLDSDRRVREGAATPQTVRHISAEWREDSATAEGDQRQGYFDVPTSQLRAQDASLSPQTDVDGYGSKTDDDAEDPKPSAGSQHHHHVPQNAFLSIGLQTVLAIALHKLPEGFITYATNHANPTLGMTVFLALFIHNISEGFVMALPLYLALNSRWRAIVWSSILGGFSQPAGAGLAALWIYVAQRAGGHKDTNTGLSWGIYGGMFAATAGVMTSVALQLFSEGLALNHNRGLGMGFAIAGMGIMGLSFALTA